ncbi:MAG TPA: hypothetical protein VMQ78_00485 [Candidatus Limnocylindria bacterium]|nr:hypothetical protein [Candidatus Limnocylindria bacterium]
MNSTEATPTPAVGGRQIGQLLAGRYRLAVSKGGDDLAEVWHALDESAQKVVTLEILRDRDNEAARQRFLAEARRMAAIERPSVMRVAAINDEGTDTFIVFEHLIPLPVVLTGLTAVAKDVRPATKAAEDRTVVLGAVAGPTRSVPAPEAAAVESSAPAIVELDVPEPPAPRTIGATALQPEALESVKRSLTSARADVSALIAWLARFTADARLRLQGVRSDTLLASARARMPGRIDMALVTSLVTSLTTRLSSRVRGLTVAAPARPALPNRFVMGGAALLVLALVVVLSPLGDAIGSALRSAPAASPTAAPPAATAALRPAPFEVPPLAAYGAAFESQGAYPAVRPNGTVEWVVALRNTGSAGWYRGIEGAQAALALPDGTGVAVQTTPYVAPGQVGWFVVNFRARAELGTYTVPLLPRIDGRGPLPELGIFAVVTVASNP